MEIEEKKLEVLYKAIDDTQQTIRFLDTKTSFSAVFIGLFLAMLGSGLSDFSKYLPNASIFFQIVFVVVLVVFILITMYAVVSAILSVYPEDNPKDFISGSIDPQGMFYVTGKLNQSKKTVITSNELKNSLNAIATIDKIQDELIVELLKVSYIRDKKLNVVKDIKRSIILLVLLVPVIVTFHVVGLSMYLPKETSQPTSSSGPSTSPKGPSVSAPFQGKLKSRQP